MSEKINDTIDKKADEIIDEKSNEIVDEKIDNELKDGSSTEDILDDNVVTSKANPLPVYGKGKYFVILVIALTALAVILGHIGSFKTGVPSAKWLRYTYIGLGAILTFLGSKL